MEVEKRGHSGEEDEVKLARAEGAYTAFTEAKLTMDKHIINPWHRVEEELPPKGFALIGARKRPPEISEDFWDMWVCEYDGEWGWQDMDGFGLRGITHWMPIEPPKEDA